MDREQGTSVSRWQIPDRPPRRRERSRWRRPPELLLIAGIALLVVGLLATFGPLALDLGGTDSPPPGGSMDDPAGADEPTEEDREGGESDADGDGTGGAGTDERKEAGGWETVGVLTSDDDRESTNADDGVECLVE